MTNPIKKFFQVLKAIVLFPVSFLQVRKTYQEMDKLRQLSEEKDPEVQKKILEEMGLSEENLPLFNPLFQQKMHGKIINEVDLSYLDEKEEEEEESFDD